MRLIRYEWSKVWKKRSFLGLLCLLLTANGFLLWYQNLPDETAAPLSAYLAITQDLSRMTESEKADFITQYKEKLDGVNFVQRIQTLQNLEQDHPEMGKALIEQEQHANPGLYESGMESYQNNDYLFYTSSLIQETALAEELYAEFEKVSGYQEYLDSMETSKNRLSEISIFQTTDPNDSKSTSFSSRNLEKSAADHQKMNPVRICWQPSKGITLALENPTTDFLLFLGLFLFIGGMITEEKEKHLFYITRTTKYGVTACFLAKLAALFLHCLLLTAFLLASNLLFAGATAGLGTLSSSLQSLAPYMESSLSLTILEYILLSHFTKSVALFGLGTILTAAALQSRKRFFPYFLGIVLISISQLLSQGIPAYSALAPFKYLNFIGLFKTQQLYGDYCNLNLAGYPVSLLNLTWILLLVLAFSGSIFCLVLFQKGENLILQREQRTQQNPQMQQNPQIQQNQQTLQMQQNLQIQRTQRKQRISFLKFRPHQNLFRHEAYKLLITNHAALVLLCFALLTGGYGLSRNYHLSAQESYYQTLMLQLEGKLTAKKEALLQAEQARFEEASQKLDELDLLAESGQLDNATADSMKTEWEAILSFFPAFERIQTQYEHIQKKGGSFVYDTGYLYLFGKQDDSLLLQFLLLSLAMVLAFFSSISMEYRQNSWFLIGATAQGRKKILQKKVQVSLLCAGLLTTLSWCSHLIGIRNTFPMNHISASIQNLPAFASFGIALPIWVFALLALLFQILALFLVTLCVLALSAWRKQEIQALILSLLLIIFPIVLY